MAPTGVVCATVAMLLLGASGACGAWQMEAEALPRPTTLRVEYARDPLGIDTAAPRFSWVTPAPLGARGVEQVSYRIVVSVEPAITPTTARDAAHSHASPARTASYPGQAQPAQATVTWDSGTVASPSNAQVVYAGEPLRSDASYSWTVMWCATLCGAPAPKCSNFSEPASFGTAFLAAGRGSNERGWQASWSGSQWLGGGTGTATGVERGVTRLRTEVVLPGTVVRARCYVASPSYYELQINGAKVGTSVLGTFTTFSRRIVYDVLDCGPGPDETQAGLVAGRNAIAVSLGNGWYSQPTVAAGVRSVLVKITAVLANGTTVEYGSNTGSWNQTYVTPTVLDDMYAGETYDARLETPGWALPGFTPPASGGWTPALEVASPLAAGGALSARTMPPIRQVTALSPARITEPAPGTWVFDFGQNMAGYCTLALDMPPRGLNVSMLHAEMLYPTGLVHHLYFNAKEVTRYIAAGHARETFTPKFTYYGFRYVQVTGLAKPPTAATLTAHFVHTDVEMAGDVSTSVPLLDAIYHAGRESGLSNVMSIPTGCDQREKRGWLGDAQVSAETQLHNMFLAPLYTKFLRDIRDAQLFANANGSIPEVVPNYEHGPVPPDPAWGAAYCLLTHWMHTHYEDARAVETHYEGIAQYVETLIQQAAATSQLLTVSTHGDWCSVANASLPAGTCSGERARVGAMSCPSTMVSSFYYVEQLRVLASMARLLNRTADEKRYASLAASALGAVTAQQFHAGSNTFGAGYQTDQVLALRMGAAPAAAAADVAAVLLADVAAHDSHLTTGMIGTKYLLGQLVNLGRPDVALGIAAQATEPSWGWWVEDNNATTLFEMWGAFHDQPGLGTASRNHVMFSSAFTFWYRTLAGVAMAADTIGWRDIEVRPFVPQAAAHGASAALTHATATVETLRGTVAVSWARMPSRSTAGGEGAAAAAGGNQRVEVNVTVPVGSAARVSVPLPVTATVMDVLTGHTVWQAGAFVGGDPGVHQGVVTGPQTGCSCACFCSPAASIGQQGVGHGWPKAAAPQARSLDAPWPMSDSDSSAPTQTDPRACVTLSVEAGEYAFRVDVQ